MNRSVCALCLSLISLVTVSGCRRTYFGAGCEKVAELGAPWKDLGLPIDEDKTRVCSSTVEELKLRSAQWGTAGEAHPAFEQALLAAGYTKDRCTGPACYYDDKAGATVSVHPIDFKVKGKTLITVVLGVRPDTGGRGRSTTPAAGARP